MVIRKFLLCPSSLKYSRVAYGNDRYLLAESTKFGTHILWANAKLSGEVPHFKDQSPSLHKMQGTRPCQ